MRVTYRPTDGDAQAWDFNPDAVRQSKAQLIEKVYGRNWDSFAADVRAGNARARRVLLWHLMQLTHHTLRYEDTPDFAMGEVRVEFSLEELAELREKVQKANLPDDERESILAALDIEITELLAEQASDGTELLGESVDLSETMPGKALSPSGS